MIVVHLYLSEQKDGESRECLKEARYEESDPPSRELGGSELSNHREHERHDQLRRATSEISPTGGDSVSRSHDGSGEHRAHPELCRDESGERESGEESHEDKSDRRFDPGGEIDGGSSGEG